MCVSSSDQGREGLRTGSPFAPSRPVDQEGPPSGGSPMDLGPKERSKSRPKVPRGVFHPTPARRLGFENRRRTDTWT